MSDQPRVAVITSRAELRSVVVRIVALSGADAEVVTASVGARRAWASAQVVIVDADVAVALVAAELPRRAAVIVVSDAAPDAGQWRAAVELGATCLVEVPAEETALVNALGDALEGPGRQGTTVAVLGASGGAGASTLAAALAVVSAEECPTLLVDADPLGGGLDVLLGLERSAGARWPDLAATRGRLNAATLASSLVRLDALAVLSWAREGGSPVSLEAAAAVMAAGVRGFSRVIVDVPRHVDDAVEVFLAASDLVVLVVPATVRGVSSAAAIVAEISDRCERLELVVRDATSHGLREAEVAGVLGLSVVASLRSESSVTQAAHRGEPPVRSGRGGRGGHNALAVTCRAVLAAATFPVRSPRMPASVPPSLAGAA